MQTSRIFHAVLEFIRTKCLRRPEPKGEQANSVMDVIIGDIPSASEVNVHKQVLSTWPLEQLEQTLTNILVVNGTVMEHEEFSRLLTKVTGKLNEECPFNINDQYDFCIICASDDYSEARAFQKDVEKRLELIGYMVSEGVSLGKDQLQVYEDVSERSSKVIFYITHNFTNDEFCCFLARNTFVAPCEELRSKLIPIVDDMSTKLPDSMILVEKLVKNNTFHIDLRLRNVFNDSVRQEKGRRNLKLQDNLDSKRLKILEEMLMDLNLINGINCQKL